MLAAICTCDRNEATGVQGLLGQYVKNHPEVTIKPTAYASGGELLAAIGQRRAGFDLYLLDIALGKESGLELARRLREMGERRRIVFMTDSPDHAMEAFSVSAAGYLLKPVKWEDIRNLLDSCTEEMLLRRNRRRNQYMFRTPEGLHTVAAEDVVYVEIVGHAPYYYLADETIRGSELRISFSEGMDALCRQGCFLRPHRSFLVNAAHIADLTPACLRMDNGDSIPVARHRSAELRAAYIEFLSRQEPPRR